nr:MAG: zinc-binding loop region of homing endonuclease [Bacteriophage sp.]
MEEIWKDIKGFEGLYKISNFGRIKNVPHWVTRKYYKPTTGDHIEDKLYIKEVIINPKKKYYHKNRGITDYFYYGVSLRKDGKYYNKTIHRLVAEAFIPNPNNLPCVNHKDENRLNNNVENLEWCTYQHNNTWKDRLKKSLETFNTNPKNRRKVYQYTKDGMFIREYESVKDAVVEMGLKCSSGIYLSCNSNNCYPRGFKWSFNPPSLEEYCSLKKMA